MRVLVFTTMYFAIYIVVSILAIVLGWRVYLLHKNISWLFFLSFTVFAFLWLMFYFLFFSEFFSSDTVLLYLSRVNFIIGISAVYSLLFFILHFDQRRIHNIAKYIFLTIILTGYFCIFTDSIIESIQFSETEWVYREVYGSWYSIIVVYYVAFLIWFIIASFIQIRQTSNLDKIRLKKILQSAYFMLAMLIFLQVFLPLFDIWIMEKELIFFYLYFVLHTYQILRRYYFGSIGYGIGRTIIFCIALIIAMSFYVLEIYLLQTTEFHVGLFWDFYDPSGIAYVAAAIAIFYLSFDILSRYTLADRRNYPLRDKIATLQKEIIPMVEYDLMNQKIRTHLKEVFGTERIDTIIFEDHPDTSFGHMRSYFEHGFTDNLYIHDIVLQEERRSEFDIDALIAEIPEWAFLIFPIMRDDTCVGILFLGVKMFGDFYTREEISILHNFAYFVSSHIRYIHTYSKLQDISLHLDQRVDEKTIEYNNLINRQKEFIAIISHEIRSPISAVIFQSDSIIDDIESNSLNSDQIRSELHILNTQLLRIGWLISKLFSVQYYDNQEVNLFREKIEFAVWLQYEVDLFAHLHSDIVLVCDIDPAIWFIDIDKIQFQQVLGNLLDNASKFLEVDNPMISIKAYRTWDQLYISLEDSGSGFEGVDMENIFDKYTTGSQGMIWLGMWLYLCKKIISMHGGTIEAKKSSEYGWAQFDISLPVI